MFPDGSSASLSFLTHLLHLKLDLFTLETK